MDRTQQTDRPNLLLTTDSYKAGHARAYPPGLTSLYGYAEARGGHPTPTFPATIFVGEQYYRLRYLTGHVVRPEDVDEAETFWSAHFGRDDYFPAAAWRRLVARHGGRLPLGWKVDGRWVCYYHPGDIGDAWADGHAGIKADVFEACFQLGVNVIYYAHLEYHKWLEAQK